MLSMDEKGSFLRDVSTFRCLTTPQLDTLAVLCHEKTFNAGERIFNQGESDGALFIVVDGQVILEREIQSSTDTVSMNMVKPGGYFGEISLFYDAPWSVSATATKPTTILKLLNDDFALFARNHVDLLVEFNHVLSQRLVEAHDKISEVTQVKKPREIQKLYDKLDF